MGIAFLLAGENALEQDQEVNILGLVNHTFSVAPTQLCPCCMKRNP
jgi:hypothetical protein